MIDIPFKTKLFTRYTNKYFRNLNIIDNWSFTCNHSSIDLTIDFIDDYHIQERIGYEMLADTPDDKINDLTTMILSNLIHKYLRKRGE